jgi:hypothetical protein
MRLMLTRCPSLRAWTLPLAAALFGLTFTTRAAQTPPAAAANAKATTNAAPAEPELPKSAFIIPATSVEGKDPFFPLSTRLHPPPPVVTPTITSVAPAVVQSVQLELKGISGAVNRRLAIINNQTFEVGEEGEVAVNPGRVRVVCKEIKDDSVLVLVNGQERTLRLRPGS